MAETFFEVGDIVDEMFWWQVWDNGDGFEKYGIYVTKAGKYVKFIPN